MTIRPVVGLVLAAGASRRMGPETNKLCVEVEGKPLVAGPVDAMLEAGIDPVFVVTGYQSEQIRSALGARPCVYLDAPLWKEGMGATMAAGVREILERIDAGGLLVCVGDLAGLRTEWVEALVTAFLQADAPDALCVPTFEGRFGHPVLFGRDYFEALCELEGEGGGKAILAANAPSLHKIPIESDAILRDLDTPGDFEAWVSKRSLD